MEASSLNGILLVIVVSLSIPAMNTTNAQEFNMSDQINLSETNSFSTDEQITAKGNNVYVIWRENNETSPNAAILFKRSVDHGATFSPNVILSNTTGFSFEPRIKVHETNVHMVWTDNSEGSNDIFYVRSPDNGTTFDNVVDLSANMEGVAGLPQLAVSDNNVYVVWRDTTPGNADIFFTKSDDNGGSFGDPINLSDNNGISGLPHITAFANNVYVTWQDTTAGNDEVFVRSSNDNGQSFGNIINLSNNPGYAFEPRIAAANNNVHVTWTERLPEGFHVFVASSNDTGKTFSKSDLTVNDIQGEFRNEPMITLLGPSNTPVISAFDNNVHVAWRDNRAANEDVYYAKSQNNGTTFEDTINLSNNWGYSSEPKIMTFGNYVIVAWSDFSMGGNPEILMAISSDEGERFSPIQRISNNPGSSGFPELGTTGAGAMATDGQNIFVIWHDDSPGNFDILYSRVPLNQ